MDTQNGDFSYNKNNYNERTECPEQWLKDMTKNLNFMQ